MIVKSLAETLQIEFIKGFLHNVLQQKTLMFLSEDKQFSNNSIANLFTFN